MSGFACLSASQILPFELTFVAKPHDRREREGQVVGNFATKGALTLRLASNEPSSEVAILNIKLIITTLDVEHQMNNNSHGY